MPSDRRISPSEDRWVSLGGASPHIPERLLLAHSKGQVLFITGAGSSKPSRLPDFRGLVVQAYREIDAAVHGVLAAIPSSAGPDHKFPASGLTHKQLAEVKRFIRGEYDVVLGMLERRIDGMGGAARSVRGKLARLLRRVETTPGKYSAPRPSPIHKALIRLADRGTALTIATTNFDRLLEQAGRGKHQRILAHSLGAIPRPGRTADFAGVLHIHGVLNEDAKQPSEFIVTDQDFGEFYLRRRVVPDFVYDAARLFHLVLVGYSANDAPMRYLLNAVAADGSRFEDLKERFAFVGMQTPFDAVALEDWAGRGITPIPYDGGSDHQALSKVLIRWADFSPVNGKQKLVDQTFARIARRARSTVPETERDLIDHLFRRSSAKDRYRLAALASKAGADNAWLDALTDIAREPAREHL
jgi:hypothetical protein